MAPNLKKLKGLGGHKSNPEYSAAANEEGNHEHESGTFLDENNRRNVPSEPNTPVTKSSPQGENPYMDEYKA